MKKILAILLTLTLIAGFALTNADTAYISAPEAAKTLNALGLLQGDGSGDLNLDKALTRQEGAVLLTRLMGLAPSGTSPFTDVAAWAQPAVNAAYNAGLVKGAGGSVAAFKAADALTLNDWATFLLRTLGYNDPADFSYAGASKFAERLGIPADLRADGSFLRENAVTMMYSALLTKKKDGSKKLIEQLVASGIFDTSKLAGTRLSGYANYGKTEYTASEIYERTSAATFFMAVYNSIEDYESDTPYASASGFFITPDGLAVIAYHSIEMMPYMRIYTTDGKVYSKITLLWRDGWRDAALIRVSQSDDNGSTESAFPYLPVGNSDLIASGDKVYTMGSPLGLSDTVSEGLIGNKSTEIEAPGYNQIQFSAQVSHGSSGGPLINRFGEAIGIVVSGYPDGNDLSFAVPLNYLPSDAKNRKAITLKEAADEDIKLNENSTIKANKTGIEINVGETAQVAITRNNPGSVGLQFKIEDEKIIDARWIDATSITTYPIKIVGLEPGTSEIVVTYMDGYGNPDAELIINVRVTGTPKPATSPAPSPDPSPSPSPSETPAPSPEPTPATDPTPSEPINT